MYLLCKEITYVLQINFSNISYTILFLQILSRNFIFLTGSLSHKLICKKLLIVLISLAMTQLEYLEAYIFKYL
jgi:hypothetical protein